MSRFTPTAGVSVLVLCIMTAFADRSMAQSPSPDFSLSGAIPIEAGNNEGFLSSAPSSFCKGNGDTVYVADTLANRVVAYSVEMGYLFGIGRDGQGPGEFINPIGVSYSEGSLYVLDSSIGRITQFRSDGTYLRTIPTRKRGLSLVVYDGFAYVTVPSAIDILYRIPLERPEDQEVIVSWNTPGVRQIRMYPANWCRLTEIDGIVIVTLPHTYQYLLVKSPSSSAPKVEVVTPKSPFIEEQKRQFKKRLDSLPADQANNEPNAFLGISRWADGLLALDLFIGEGPSYNPVTIVVGVGMGNEVFSIKTDVPIPGPCLRISATRVLYGNASDYRLYLLELPAALRSRSVQVR